MRLSICGSWWTFLKEGWSPDQSSNLLINRANDQSGLIGSATGCSQRANRRPCHLEDLLDTGLAGAQRVPISGRRSFALLVRAAVRREAEGTSTAGHEHAIHQCSRSLQNSSRGVKSLMSRWWRDRTDREFSDSTVSQGERSEHRPGGSDHDGTSSATTTLRKDNIVMSRQGYPAP